MKRRRVVVTSVLLALILPCWTTGATASEMDSADVKAIQEVVQSQLNALDEDDAVRAFALATESTRSVIGSAENFLRMIKEEYDPIYRHRRALFSTPEVIDGNTIQIVRVTARDNHVWLAVYKMQQESDGKWKIEGCQLLETTSVSV
jgi:hypothetical protein